MEDAINMTLRFPKARMLINNLIIEMKGNCSSALLHASLESGILPWGTNIPEVNTADNVCRALETAELILEKYFDTKKLPDKKKHIETFRKNFNLFKSVESQKNKNKVECLRLTPVIFDLLLQQIECV